MTIDFRSRKPLLLRVPYRLLRWKASCRRDDLRTSTPISVAAGNLQPGDAEMGAVTGVDFSGEMLAVPQAKDGASDPWIQADAADTRLPDSSCDLVLLRAVIHHFSAEKTAGCLESLVASSGRLDRRQDRTGRLPASGGPDHLRLPL